ncbi:MAG: helix-turn-helix transcriptional regulator [Lachnospiraceae bacterium]|nr:helix-turn-helix transcriptional regulator [Lachnospiraceae bacterium]
MGFAEKLIVLRNQHGYTQEKMAEELQISRQAISKWESGTTLPDTDKLVQLSDYFNVSIDYLLKDRVQLNRNETVDRAILKFLSSVQNMDDISKDILKIMGDGVIDEDEKVRMNEIIATLDMIAENIEEIKSKISYQN